MNLHPAKAYQREVYCENKDIFHATFHCAARPHVASVIICKENQILCYREVWDPHTNHKKSMCIHSAIHRIQPQYPKPDHAACNKPVAVYRRITFPQPFPPSLITVTLDVSVKHEWHIQMVTIGWILPSYGVQVTVEITDAPANPQILNTNILKIRCTFRAVKSSSQRTRHHTIPRLNTIVGSPFRSPIK